MDAIVGADGQRRCPWAGSTPDYVQYHDVEWGQPVHGDQPLFERLTLEAFQSGLSWLTILRKRENFRSAFDGFEIDRIAGYGDADCARLMADPGIVRNRRKIEATVTNARAARALLDRDGDGSLDRLIWSFQPESQPRPSRLADLRTQTPESAALSRALKSEGFVWVGPTTMHAAMQACGLVDDHLADCWVSRR